MTYLDRLHKPRNLWYFGVASAGAVGFLTLNPFLMGLPFYMLAVWLMVSRLFGQQLEQIKLKRKAPRGVYEQGECSTRFYLRNDHTLPLLMPVARDRIPFSRDFETEKRYTGVVWPGESVVCEYNVPCKARFGRFTLGPTSVTIGDPIGLVERKRVFEQYQPITLYPRWESLEWLPFYGSRRHFAENEKSTTKTARGQDIYGIREYQRGDPVRHIHWRSVARHRELMVKEFEMPASRSIHLFIDLHRDRKRGLGSRTTRRITARVAASVAVYGIETGHRVSLHGDGARPLYLPPGGGVHQQRAILDALVDIQQEGETELDQLLSSHLPDLDDQASVVLVIPTTRIDPERYVRSLAILRGRRANVLVFLIDDSGMVRYDGTAEEYERDWNLKELEASFRAQGAWCRAVSARRPLDEQIPSPGEAGHRAG